MYVLIVNHRKKIRCRVILAETLRHSWKDHENKGWLLFSIYEDWDSSQAALRAVKSLSKLNTDSLKPINKCWEVSLS